MFLNTHAIALLTSANAVHCAHRILPFPWQKQQVHAIGTATAHALEQYGQRVTLIPPAPFNSEAYLEQVTNRPPESLLIIKGSGGRGLIQPALETRGWQVNSVDVYKRILPDVPTDDIDALFVGSAPDIVSIGSDEVLTNLCQLCHHYKKKLQTIPLVVNSQRCVQLATKLGFQSAIRVAMPPGDKGQLACLADWRKTEFNKQSQQYNQ